MLVFDTYCEETCNSKAFVDITSAGRHRGQTTIYIKHNLLHESQLGQNVELQKNHTVFFKPLCNVMHVSPLSAYLGLGWELVDWYRDATSVPYCQFLTDLSPRTDNQLRYCVNSRFIPTESDIPDQLKQSKVLDRR